MKNKKLFNALLASMLLFTTVSCGETATSQESKESESKQEQSSQTESKKDSAESKEAASSEADKSAPASEDKSLAPSEEPSDSSKASEPGKDEKVTITVNYVYDNGSKAFDSVTREVDKDEAYSISSPAAPNFMKADKTVVEGSSSTNQEITVTYSYSDELTGTLPRATHYDPIFVDPDKGLSMTFAIDGGVNDWETLFQSDTFIIHQGCLKAYEVFSEEDTFAQEWYDQNESGHVKLHNNAAWNTLIGAEECEKLVTYNFTPEGDILCYVDGLLKWEWNSDLAPDNSSSASCDPEFYIFDYVNTFFKDMSTVGFSTGGKEDEQYACTHNIRNLVFDYAKTEEEITDIYESYAKTTVNYNLVLGESSTLVGQAYHYDKIGSTYSFTTPARPNFTPDQEVVTGVAEESKEINVSYSFAGTEHVTEPMVLDKSTGAGWTDNSEWIYCGEFTGEFIAIIKFNSQSTLDGGTNFNDSCWRCPLTIAYSTSNKEYRSVERFDWWAWQDGSFCDSVQTGNSWIEWTYAALGAVYEDMDCTLVVTRTGNNLTYDWTIYSSKLDKTYTWQQNVYGIHHQKIGIAFAAEWAKLTVNSVLYIDQN